MPIQFPNFQPLNFDETNPYLKGMGQGQNLMQGFMRFPQELQKLLYENQIKGTEAKYAEPMAQQGLIKEQQHNKYYPQDILSQIGLRGGQTSQAYAQAGNLREQTRWMGPDTASQIGLRLHQGNEMEANAGNLREKTRWYGSEAQAGINLKGGQTAEAYSQAARAAEQAKYYQLESEANRALQAAQTKEQYASAKKLGEEAKYYWQVIQSNRNLQRAQAENERATANKTKKQTSRYDKEMDARIMLQQQQANEMNANAGNLREKTKNYGFESEARRGLEQAQSQEARANAQKTQMLVDELNKGGGGTQQGSESQYGIETPQLTPQDIKNKALFGQDTFTPKMKSAQEQQAVQRQSYEKEMASSIQQANAGQKMQQAMNVFNAAMDRSYFKGSTLGHVSTSLPLVNMSSEQSADRASLQMLPAVVEGLRDAMHSSRFSNLEFMTAKSSKFDRTMDDETRKLMTDWIGGINQRFKEQPKFYQMMGNPQSGAKKSEADQLWAAYQQQFPIISNDGKSFESQNLDNWPLFTTPKAIASIQTTGTYKPTKSEKNTYMMKYPDGNQLPVNAGQIEEAFRAGARPL
jgi:hypothetical protein